GTAVNIEAVKFGTRIFAARVNEILQADAQSVITASGYIASTSPGEIRVGGLAFKLDNSTLVNGKPQVGARAIIWAVVNNKELQPVYVDVLDDVSVYSYLKQKDKSPRENNGSGQDRGEDQEQFTPSPVPSPSIP
ncbi:MAG TPA: hypothetical protein VNL15_07810, partial [Dehalococcoidia bacterium]|nr:hypothetical protein [Dehalococcoidia bacterium]